MNTFARRRISRKSFAPLTKRPQHRQAVRRSRLECVICYVISVCQRQACNEMKRNEIYLQILQAATLICTILHRLVFPASTTGILQWFNDHHSALTCLDGLTDAAASLNCLAGWLNFPLEVVHTSTCDFGTLQRFEWCLLSWKKGAVECGWLGTCREWSELRCFFWHWNHWRPRTSLYTIMHYSLL